MSAISKTMSRVAVRNHVLLVSEGPAAPRFRTLLRRAGFAVAVAESGLAALSAATRTREIGSQVIVIDIDLGETDALRLIEQLREQLRDSAVQIIAVASSREPMLEVACFGAGADDFVGGKNVEVVLASRVRAHSRIAERTAQLLQLSVRDELTGAHNRRGTTGALAAEIDRARRSGRSVSLLLIDIDHFKTINDTHGHGVGDQVLIDLAERMNTLLRSTDIVGRIGGDEFVVVLPEVDGELVDALAARVAKAASEVCVGPYDQRLAVSIGVATYDPKSGQTTPEELIGLADGGMYERKRRKRRTTKNEQVLAA